MFEFLTRGLSYKNALVAMALDSVPEVEAYITWIKKPLENKLRTKVLTPAEYLRATR